MIYKKKTQDDDLQKELLKEVSVDQILDLQRKEEAIKAEERERKQKALKERGLYATASEMNDDYY